MCISWTNKELNIINMHGATTKVTTYICAKLNSNHGDGFKTSCSIGLHSPRWPWSVSARTIHGTVVETNIGNPFPETAYRPASLPIHRCSHSRALTEETKKVRIVASGWDSNGVFSDWDLFLFTMGSEIWNTRALVKDNASQHNVMDISL